MSRHAVGYSVIGAGKSGVAASNLLVSRGHDVVLYEDRADAPRPAGLDARVGYEAGHHDVRLGDVAVLSPGVPEVSPVRAEVAARAAKVIGELELFALSCELPILAVTGTDGKSTTTTMLGDIMAASGRPTIVGGNLGNPLTGEVALLQPGGVVVAEVSCFQLTTCETFCPAVAIVTNIAEDHTDYHGSFGAYQAAKRRVWDAMGPSGAVVLNADDPHIRGWLEGGAGPQQTPVYWFSSRESVTSVRGISVDVAAFLRDAVLYVTPPGGDATPLMTRPELPLVGDHNVMNALAAAQAAVLAGVEVATCRAALMAYRPLPHRLNPVGTVDGVTWVNDSKATNPNAAMAGVRAISGPLTALVGGSSKDADFGELAALLAGRADRVVCFGQTRDLVAAALHGAVLASGASPERARPEVHVVPSMEAAMDLARSLTQGPATVLLAPACASFDAYKGYHHRGEVFEARVRSWLAGA